MSFECLNVDFSLQIMKIKGELHGSDGWDIKATKFKFIILMKSLKWLLNNVIWLVSHVAIKKENREFIH